jgi:hypothetical protein
MDLVAIARGQLADPDWARKVANGEADRIVHCAYCNVCKRLDGTHKKVFCFLWPKGSIQAPPDDPAAASPRWGADRGALEAELDGGQVVLTWSEVEGAARYDIYRADDDGGVTVADAVKTNRWVDGTILAGMRYRYYVRACGPTGQASPPSNTVAVEPRLAAYAPAARPPPPTC